MGRNKSAGEELLEYLFDEEDEEYPSSERLSRKETTEKYIGPSNDNKPERYIGPS